jgi:NTP pyrophosphatase (non-canonical NTP hydrolase)
MNTEVYEYIAFQFYEDKHRHCDHLGRGLAEEVEEVCQELYDNKGRDREAYLDELADVLWYVTVMSMVEGENLESLMKRNIYKLEDRILNGKRNS